MITSTARSSKVGSRLIALAKALCLVGFPVIPLAINRSGVHPSLPGPTSADQIRQLAEQAERWTQAHFAFSVAGFLGIAVILVLRSKVVSKANALLVEGATAVGIVGAVIFTGTVLMEVRVVPALSKACAASPLCLLNGNSAFTDQLANEGWRVLPGLTQGGRTMMVGVALLAMIGFGTGALRVWEGGPIFMGGFLEVGLNTGLHAWGNFNLSRGMPGLAAVALFLGGAALAARLVRESWLVRAVERVDSPLLSATAAEAPPGSLVRSVESAEDPAPPATAPAAPGEVILPAQPPQAAPADEAAQPPGG
ncbi:MAG: hypothetical protein ACT4OM_01000 [Actinomycetota bacterium]